MPSILETVEKVGFDAGVTAQRMRQEGYREGYAAASPLRKPSGGSSAN
jgi:hypothetical protein